MAFDASVRVYWGRALAYLIALLVVSVYVYTSVGRSQAPSPHRPQPSPTAEPTAAVAALPLPAAVNPPAVVEPPAPPASPPEAVVNAHVKPKRKVVGQQHWVTDELDQYASLVQVEVRAAWAGLDAVEASRNPAGGIVGFGDDQSEFFLGMSMTSLDIEVVCEVGAVSGRSAITWLESGDQVEVWSFLRPTGLGPASLEESNQTHEKPESTDHLQYQYLQIQTAHEYQCPCIFVAFVLQSHE
eukprot:COSAG01_NODE_4586_length_4894_cov_6.028989_3_plen_242_part_00